MMQEVFIPFLMGYIIVGLVLSIALDKLIVYLESRDDANDFIDDEFRSLYNFSKEKIMAYVAVMWLPLMIEMFIPTKKE